MSSADSVEPSRSVTMGGSAKERESEAVNTRNYVSPGASTCSNWWKRPIILILSDTFKCTRSIPPCPCHKVSTYTYSASHLYKFHSFATAALESNRCCAAQQIQSVHYKHRTACAAEKRMCREIPLKMPFLITFPLPPMPCLSNKYLITV